MKKIATITLLILCLFGGYAQNKKKITLEVEITNRISDTITVTWSPDKEELSRKIVVNKKGVFKDSFVFEGSTLFLNNGKANLAAVFAKDRYKIKLKVDAKKGNESAVFSGDGAAENNYNKQSVWSEIILDWHGIMTLSQDDFTKTVDQAKAAAILNLESKKLDIDFVKDRKELIETALGMTTDIYNKKIEAAKLNGSASPTFDYDNYAGGKSKLEDFKGKYVYIDVWATWCGPCKAEIPFLKKVEEKYHGKNIAFVSISVDVQKDIEKWKTMVKKEALGGVQLIADKDFESQFVKDYGIQGIPKFILIDPNGNIVSADAARPSDPALQEQLDKLLK